MTVLLWDIDGTLLSTARAGVVALERAALELTGRRPDLATLRSAGLTDGQLAARILEALDAPAGAGEIAAFLAAYERELPGVLGLRKGHVMPGVREVLEDLEGDPAVLSLLLTGNTEAGAHAKLAHYGLARHFGHGGAFCVDDGARAGIAARAIARAEAHHGAAIEPERTLVIGDTAHDVDCARAVGVRCLAVATGGATAAELEAAGAWTVVDRLPAPPAFRALIGAGAPQRPSTAR